MNIEIGAVCKRLRKERGITQEALAANIGVSFQAVSKWERGDGYPDITVLPPLARCFGVTLDVLMGLDAAQDAADAQKLLDAAYAASAEGGMAKSITLLRDGVQKYPSHYEMWTALAGNLRALRTDAETAKRNTEEAVEIYERVLEQCTDSGTRNKAQAMLCYAYADAGLCAKAAETARTLPDILFGKLIAVDFLDGAAKRTALQKAFVSAVEAVDWQFYRLYHMDELNDRETVAMLRKALTVLETVLNGEYLHLAVNVAERYLGLAKAYMRLGERDNALDALEHAVEFAEQYDRQPNAYVYESLPLRGLAFHKDDYSKDFTEPYGDWLKQYMREPVFAPLCGNARYEKLL